MGLRVLIICLVAGGLAIVGPSAAGAGDSIYRGAVKADPAAKLSFALVKGRGLEKVVRIEFENVDLTCEGAGPDRLWFDPKGIGPAVVRKDGSWTTKRSSSVDVEGRFSKNRKRASGTFEFEAQLYGPGGEGPPTYCYTGELDWAAQRR